ncbi:MAG: EAL domain-containing protein [Acidobacteriota bacterium]
MTLQQRVLALFLTLLLLVLAITMVTVSQATYSHTMDRAKEQMVYARRIFQDKLQTRQKALDESARTLASEEALRQAIFADAGDRESILVALNNHRHRTSADLSFLVDLDGTVIADTADAKRQGRPFPFPELLNEEPTPTEMHVLALDGRAYQMVAVPYYVPVSAPQPSFWLILGKALDDGTARDLRDLMGVEVSVLASSAAHPDAAVLASSLGPLERGALAHAARPRGDTVELVELVGGDYLAATAPLSPGPDGGFVAVLLRPTAAALLDFRKLSGRFLIIGLAAALLAIVSAVLFSRGVTRPIRGLEEAAQRIAAGDYAAELPLEAGGEVGRLAREFAAMQRAVREREEAIQHLAFHDDLTGLPNRIHFQRALARHIELAREQHGRLAVLVLDLDRFKDINDALGHHVGDRLLMEVAGRLCRAAGDGPVDVARLGGDEFAMLLPVRALGEAREAVDAVQSTVSGAVEIEDLRVDLQASVGVSLYPDHGADPATLLKQAEVAMYVAKGRRLGAVFYESSQDRHSIERLSLVGDLRRAVEDDTLSLRFQPQMELTTGRVDAVEVLLRWNHPRLGEVSPAEFIPIAEQTGLIRDLTAWVLRRAVEQVAAWHRQGLAVVVAVNLSALDLHDPDLPGRIRELLDRNCVAAESLVLEVTESGVMAEPETARRLLDELNAMGVAISIDDFGTGYSSLSQLKRLPVQELKVDKSFVLEMERSADVRQIVRSTIEMAHSLGLRVVAEGVESVEALESLRGMGCDIVQGYYLSEPIAVAEATSWLRAAADRREARTLDAT